MALDRLPDGEDELFSAEEWARSQGRYPLSWRIQLEPGRLYLAQAREEAAEREFSAARSVIDG